jgi:glyoxylase-like metal-dependent hydrolase (beta-lactamase superfamily II)
VLRIIAAVVIGAAGADAAEINHYTSSENGFAVNSWIVPSNSGVIVIDTQFTVSDADNLAKVISESGQPLRAIIITHPHPDHYNGTCRLLELAHVPVYATSQTISGIKTNEAAKRAEWKPFYGAAYPDRTCLPDHPVTAGSTIAIDGLNFEFRDYGAGEAESETVIFAPSLKAAFTGDIIYNTVHPWLAEGRSDQWLSQLERLSEELPWGWQIFPGHGPAEGAAVIHTQYDYILAFRDLVAFWLSPQKLVYQAEAVFHFKNGHDVRLPYVNVLTLTPNHLIGDYRIYIDFPPQNT